MFNNSLEEVDEEEVRSPTLTQESIAISEESSGRYSPTPSSSNHFSHTSPESYMHAHIPDLLTVNQPTQNPSDSTADATSNLPTPATAAFPPISIPSRPTTPSGRAKLRKKRSDGYESDGGYISDGGKKKKDKKRAPRSRMVAWK